MTQVNFSGHGTDSIENLVGKGQGLKVGRTKIDFATGKIQYNDGETIGQFRTLKNQGKESSTIKSFCFKSTTKCIIEFQDTFINYNLINEWTILQGISTELISIIREATGLTTDIFDFSFIGSDNENYKLSIEKGTRDSDIETVLPSLSRAVATYTQNINVQGAKKIILIGKATAGTGNVNVTLEIFDPASGTWIEHIPVEDVFNLVNGEFKRKQFGDTISRKPLDDEILVAWALAGTILATSKIGQVAGNGANPTYDHVSGAVASSIGYVLPSGDAILRAKCVVAVSSLTFSLGIIKVFE